ncbi:MAG: hypothetical protein ACOYXS_08765 [Chloroflexota bacterium]
MTARPDPNGSTLGVAPVAVPAMEPTREPDAPWDEPGQRTG